MNQEKTEEVRQTAEKRAVATGYFRLLPWCLDFPLFDSYNDNGRLPDFTLVYTLPPMRSIAILLFPPFFLCLNLT